MSGSLSEKNKCMYEGSYKFRHSMSLKDEPRCRFKNGTKSNNDSGYTILVPVSDGFSFTGGHEKRWQITATCVDQKRANVQITLYNQRCNQQYITTAKTTMDVGENGEILLNDYHIEWTCGGESLSCNMVESWSLSPEIW
jgi:hypothetical protein